ncbi:MAG TPA: hypothetical protein VMZ29_02960 [Candidatus Bathyarchaeia archaeon]|nr:hypothetical protein [Candidatus Bathyarchaeia archaeon]
MALGSIIIAQLATPLGGYQYLMQSASVFLLLVIIPAIFLIIWLKKGLNKVEINPEKLVEPVEKSIIE